MQGIQGKRTPPPPQKKKLRVQRAKLSAKEKLGLLSIYFPTQKNSIRASSFPINYDSPPPPQKKKMKNSIGDDLGLYSGSELRVSRFGTRLLQEGASKP